jgi:citrate lyase beta subunit
MAEPALSPHDLAAIDALLGDDDAERAARYPGTRVDRQPVHTVYVPADKFHADLAPQWGRLALEALDRFAPDAEQFAIAADADPAGVAEVWSLVRAKLESEPIEDLRIDLEDGYGAPLDDVEDTHARAAGAAVASASALGTLPPYCGLRFKSLEGSTRARGIRSLDLMLGAVLEGGGLPDGWVVTLPKVTSVRQVGAMVELGALLEARYGLVAGSIHFEVQVETPQAILASNGTATVARIVAAAEGRCTGLHFGTYDYTAALGIAGGDQALDHPAADHAKSVMQLAAAGTPVRVSDGSTNILPIGDQAAVHRAWALHARLVRRSLERGIYQGWDLHPAQLPSRYLATYLYFRRGLDEVTSRLATYLEGRSHGVLDEPATAQAMAAFLLRGVHCGAVGTDEIETLVGADAGALSVLASRRIG